MDRCAVGEAARDPAQSLNGKRVRAFRDSAQAVASDFPNQHFPDIHIARIATEGRAIFQSQ